MQQPLDTDALALAAERTNLTPAQVAAALVAFRHVNSELEEPDWGLPICHMTMKDCGISQWGADGTGVVMQMWTPRKDDFSWGVGQTSYLFDQTEYETFGEARSAEFRKIPATTTPAHAHLEEK